MVSASQNAQTQVLPLDYLDVNFTIDKHIRYRTRVFAAEYVIIFSYYQGGCVFDINQQLQFSTYKQK